MRLKITLCYNGSSFKGFQIQKQTKQTVANQIELALTKLGIKTKIVASGRTDKAVHAKAQVIHIDVESFWNTDKLHSSLNKILPKSINIKHIEIVNDNFHARYDVTKRSYIYIFTTNKPNPFLDDIITYIHHEINEIKIKQALKCFVGSHDFEYFMKTGSGVKTYNREIYKIKLIKLNNNTYACYFLANGFLRSQIRIMMDFLFKISQNKLEIEHLKRQLNKEQIFSNSLAPANGLYLSKIYYNAKNKGKLI